MIWRYLNGINYIIFKDWGPKCILCKNPSTHPILGALFISAPLFLILYFFKKSKVITFN